MHMRNYLAGFLPIVQQDIEAGGLRRLRNNLGELLDSGYEQGELLPRNLGKAFIMVFQSNECVAFCGGIDVHEGDNLVILIDAYRGYFAMCYPAEYAFSHMPTIFTCGKTDKKSSGFHFSMAKACPLLMPLVKGPACKKLGNEVRKRMDEFREMRDVENEDWFSELCFCLLTANSTAESGIKVQAVVRKDGFLSLKKNELTTALKRAHYRYPNKRADYIIGARKKAGDLQATLKSFETSAERREWLVKNIKGLGYKESSHFLRNVGYFDLAILDRHVLRIMNDKKLIRQMPKTLNREKYLEIEETLAKEAKAMKLTQGELDLWLWASQTGRVLK